MDTFRNSVDQTFRARTLPISASLGTSTLEISTGRRGPLPVERTVAEVVFLEAVRDSYLYQHVEHATRKRGNDDPSLIDLIFTDEEMQVSDVSHHSPLGKAQCHNIQLPLLSRLRKAN